MTIAMGLFVNFPVALAPGMGLNAYFATIILTSQGKFTFSMALTAVFISGIIFIILTITRVRQMLLVAVPDSLKHAITVGIGLFIAMIGFKNSGILTVAVESGNSWGSGYHHEAGTRLPQSVEWNPGPDGRTLRAVRADGCPENVVNLDQSFRTKTT